jgi:hypothetical protein
MPKMWNYCFDAEGGMHLLLLGAKISTRYKMEIESALYGQTAEILKLANSFIAEGSDMAWTSYDRPSDLRAVLDLYIERLDRSDHTVFDAIKFIFAPTASLQEHSISKGWSDQYLKLSSKFDRLAEELTH